MFRTFVFTVAAFSAVACKTPGRVATWEQDPAAAKDAVATASTAADPMDAVRALWAQRDDEAKLNETITALDAVIAANPSHAEALVLMARANYFLADGHLALKDGAQEAEFKAYQKGVDAGEKALVLLEPEFGAAMRGGAKFEEAITKITNKGVAAAYWYAVNLGRFASKQGLSTRLFYKDKLKATMERIRELEPNFFYGAADRYFGAFYALLPSIAGKDINKSESHFDASIKLAPEYLATRVVKAQFLAVEKDDEAMYRAILAEVLAAPDTDNADIAPENRAAKRTAQRMLDKIGDVF